MRVVGKHGLQPTAVCEAQTCIVCTVEWSLAVHITNHPFKVQNCVSIVTTYMLGIHRFLYIYKSTTDPAVKGVDTKVHLALNLALETLDLAPTSMCTSIQHGLVIFS